jgi:hypothetical protein
MSSVTYRVSVARHEGKRPLANHRRRRKDNIKIVLTAIRCDIVDWIILTQERDNWWAVVMPAMNIEPEEHLDQLRN